MSHSLRIRSWQMIVDREVARHTSLDLVEHSIKLKKLGVVLSSQCVPVSIVADPGFARDAGVSRVLIPYLRSRASDYKEPSRQNLRYLRQQQLCRRGLRRQALSPKSFEIRRGERPKKAEKVC